MLVFLIWIKRYVMREHILNCMYDNGIWLLSGERSGGVNGLGIKYKIRIM